MRIAVDARPLAASTPAAVPAGRGESIGTAGSRYRGPRSVCGAFRSLRFERLRGTGEEAREGLTSYQEKRKPVFPKDCPI